MKFLRRLLGPSEPDAAAGEPDDGRSEDDPETVDAMERELNVALLRAEDERLDELRLRQLRYARYAWRPPAQGGDRRADDADRERDVERGSADD